MVCQTVVCQTTTRRLALGSPYSKPSTAEDVLPHPEKPMMLRRATLSQYSRGAHPMQRGRPTSNRLAVDSQTVYGLAERVRALGLCSRRSFGDSNAHTGPLAATGMGAHVFQTIPEVGSGRLPARHTPGNGIPRKTGSKRAGQGESQNTPGKNHSNPGSGAKLQINSTVFVRQLSLAVSGPRFS